MFIDLYYVRFQVALLHNYIGLAFGIDWSSFEEDEETSSPPCRYIYVGITLGFINAMICIRPWGIPEENVNGSDQK